MDKKSTIKASDYIKTDIPVEVYNVKGRDVHVWRGDLMGDGYWLPRWSKVGAIYNLLEKYVDRNRPLTHMAVDGSWSGWTIAAFAEELGIEFYYSFPDSKKFNRQIVEDTVKKYPNTKLNPVTPNMLQIMYNVLKNQVEDNDWQMLPYAFNHPWFLNYNKELMKAEGNFDNLVVSSGSGVVLSGLLHGFYEEELKEFFHPNLDRHVWTTCQSSIQSVEKIVRGNGIHIPINIEKSEYEFDDRMDGYEAPFPCNQFWDLKQWKWLEDNIEKLEGTILFWNIGGNYEY